MNKFVLTIFLILSFQSLAKADDIKDFEIEGISIGESLLNYISSNEINRKVEYHKEQGKNKDVGHITHVVNSELFFQINASFKTDDKNFEIISITAFVNIESDIKKCESKKKNIVLEISSVFNNTKKWDTGKQKHEFDQSSTYYGTVFEFDTNTNSREFIRVQCYDWSKKAGYDDQLRIEIVSRTYFVWLENLYENLN